MSYEAINLADKFSKFTDHWSPRVIAELNDYQFKLAKLQGDFIWHSHAVTDEAFIVIKGTLHIEMRDGTITLNKGEMHVVPKGVEHRPYCTDEVHLMLIEPRGVINTGDGDNSDITAENDVWV
jgi:mannose-6-phosphate isomerase-like protein (cupin superfamily)